MQALLNPCIQRELGLVMFKPGRELMQMFVSGRMLISNEPYFMKDLPTGGIPLEGQQLAMDESLGRFFQHPEVIAAAGGVDVLEQWLLRGTTCQWTKGDYHDVNITTLRCGRGAIRLCWHHDNEFREGVTPAQEAIADRNLAEWILDKARVSFMLPEHHQVTLPELCWWATLNGVISAMPDEPARRVMKWPEAERHAPVMRESDIRPLVLATDILQEKAKQVLELQIDPEPPESFMLRPKRRRWVNERYTRWVKSQPCVCCGRPADDPHHIIGYGQGGTGTKAHDLFVIPLCRAHHDELHRDTAAFEHQHGLQPEMLLRTLDKALAIGVIATGKK